MEILLDKAEHLLICKEANIERKQNEVIVDLARAIDQGGGGGGDMSNYYTKEQIDKKFEVCDEDSGVCIADSMQQLYEAFDGALNQNQENIENELDSLRTEVSGQLYDDDGGSKTEILDNSIKDLNGRVTTLESKKYAEIDDNSTTALDKTWSAKKLNTVLGDIYEVLAKITGVKSGNDL